MFQMVANICRWISIPALLIASVFSAYIAAFEFLVNFAVCLGAIFFVQRAIGKRQYHWAAGFAMIAVVFGPVQLVFKVFLLLGLACLATLGTVYRSFRKPESEADWPGALEPCRNPPR